MIVAEIDLPQRGLRFEIERMKIGGQLPSGMLQFQLSLLSPHVGLSHFASRRPPVPDGNVQGGLCGGPQAIQPLVIGNGKLPRVDAEEIVKAECRQVGGALDLGGKFLLADTLFGRAQFGIPAVRRDSISV